MSDQTHIEPVHYLWHLHKIGLTDGNNMPLPAWDDILSNGCANTIVAIIDNGMAADHPNLCKNRILAEWDFSTTRRGAIYNSHGHDDVAQLASANALVNDAGRMAGFMSFSATLDGGGPDWDLFNFENLTHINNPSHLFGNHGTATAGVVAGRAPAGPVSAGESNGILNYYGVDPTADILSISTLYNYEYWPVTQALVHAYLAGAQVVVMPRPVQDHTVQKVKDKEPKTDHIQHIDDLRLSRLTNKKASDYKALKDDKALFEAVLSFVSTQIPVVVAAGNAARADFEYPASLQHSVAPNLIVATAASSDDVRATYSSGATGGLNAPSNGGVIADADTLRIDPNGWAGRNIPYTNDDKTPRDNSWSPFSILSLDIPGEYGYAGDRDLGLYPYTEDGTAIPDQGSLYTTFGGTSAACAMIGGLASLMQRRAGGGLSGAEVKSALDATVATQPDVPGKVKIVQLPPAS